MRESKKVQDKVPFGVHFCEKCGDDWWEDIAYCSKCKKFLCPKCDSCISESFQVLGEIYA